MSQGSTHPVLRIRPDSKTKDALVEKDGQIYRGIQTSYLKDRKPTASGINIRPNREISVVRGLLDLLCGADC
jgi:hypothetical protein